MRIAKPRVLGEPQSRCLVPTAIPLPHGRGDAAHHGGSGFDPLGMPKTRNIGDPYEHIDRIKVKTRDFR